MVDTSSLCYRSDDMYGDFPSLDEINRDYSELIDVIGDVTTKEQIIELLNNTELSIEANGDYPDQLDGNVEEIRYEAYGCLAYIYCKVQKGNVIDISFDVWSNLLSSEFIQGTSIGQLEENYNRFLRKDECL